MSTEIFDDDDYVIFRKDGSIGRGGGVLLAIKSSLCPIRLDNLENLTSEVVWAEIMYRNKKYLIASVYRSPSNSDVENKALLDSLHNGALITDKYEACFIAGDFNLQVDWSGSAPRPRYPLSDQVLSCFYDFVPNQMATSPTRTINGMSNILDLFVSNNTDDINSVDVIPGISDHDAVLALLNLPSCVDKSNVRSVFDFKQAKWQDLKELLLSRLLVNFDSDDINTAWEMWSSNFWSCVNSCIPKTDLKLKKRHHWISKQVKSLIMKRNRIYRLLRNYPNSLELLQSYRTVSKHVRLAAK
jgi:hypothetical protein